MTRPEKETLVVEFKSDRKGLPIDDICRELVAMANCDGGAVYLGVEDNGTPTGINKIHKDTVKLMAQIQERTNPSLIPNIRTENWDGVDIIVIDVKSSRTLVSTGDGRYLRRRIKQDGTPEVTAILPQELVQRLSYIQAFDASAQVIESVKASDALSSVERERLRGMVETYHGDSSLLELSNDDLDKALDLCKERDGVLYPTVAGLLLIGRERFIKEYIPGHEVLFQVMNGEDVLYNSPSMRGSLLSIFDTASIQFQSRIVENEIQVGLFRVPIPNYEKDAFREGFVNALVHRDYYRMGAVQIQLNKQSMMIASPGGFPEGITPDNILSIAPTPRNRVLAEAVKRIGLAERTGRGVDKIYSSMLRSGHDIPDYADSNHTCVILRLNSAELDKEFVRMLVTEERKLNKNMPVNALIILNTLKRERRASLSELSKRIQRSEYEAKETIEWLVEIGMIEGVGNGRARHYMLSSNIYALSGNSEGYERQHGMTTEQEISMIRNFLEEHGAIRRSDIVRECKCKPDHASFLLGKLLSESIIEKVGNGRSTYYHRKL